MLPRWLFLTRFAAFFSLGVSIGTFFTALLDSCAFPIIVSFGQFCPPSSLSIDSSLEQNQTSASAERDARPVRQFIFCRTQHAHD